MLIFIKINNHFEAGGSGEATFKDGVATVGVSGDVAALVGLEVDVSVKVDTNQIVSDAKVVAHESEQVVNVVAPVVNQTVNVVNDTVNQTVNKAEKEVNKIGNSFKKAFHF